MVVLGGGAVSHERGTAVTSRLHAGVERPVVIPTRCCSLEAALSNTNVRSFTFEKCYFVSTLVQGLLVIKDTHHPRGP